MFIFPIHLSMEVIGTKHTVEQRRCLTFQTSELHTRYWIPSSLCEWSTFQASNIPDSRAKRVPGANFPFWTWQQRCMRQIFHYSSFQKLRCFKLKLKSFNVNVEYTSLGGNLVDDRWQLFSKKERTEIRNSFDKSWLARDSNTALVKKHIGAYSFFYPPQSGSNSKPSSLVFRYISLCGQLYCKPLLGTGLKLQSNYSTVLSFWLTDLSLASGLSQQLKKQRKHVLPSRTRHRRQIALIMALEPGFEQILYGLMENMQFLHCIFSFGPLKNQIFQIFRFRCFLHLPALTVSSLVGNFITTQDVILADGKNSTSVWLLSSMWRLESAVKFRTMTRTGYETKAPPFMVVVVLSSTSSQILLQFLARLVHYCSKTIYCCLTLSLSHSKIVELKGSTSQSVDDLKVGVGYCHTITFWEQLDHFLIKEVLFFW